MSSQPNPKPAAEVEVLVLAAGLGTRMKSVTAKVLHKLDGRPLIAHVCRTAAQLEPRAITVIARGSSCAAVRQTCAINGRPSSLCSTFAVTDFMRVPRPAASTSTSTSAAGLGLGCDDIERLVGGQ